MDIKKRERLRVEEPLKRLKPKVPKPKNTEVHNDIRTSLGRKKTLLQGEYDIFMRNLRISYKNNEISKEDFYTYQKMAEKKLNKAQNFTENEEYESNNQRKFNLINRERKEEKAFEKELKEARFEEEKILEKEIKDEKLLDESKKEISKKINKAKRVFELMRSPFFRISAFVLIGTILLFYLTKSSLSSESSPIIIIFIILLLILIIGRSGKAKEYEGKDFFN